MYAAFGDSIAAGYALPGYQPGQEAPDGSYQAIVAGFLQTQSCNYAVTGDNSDDCLAILTSNEADACLSDADVVTLSIGSNDLLLPFIDILMQHFHPGDAQPGTSAGEMPEEAELRKEIEEQLKTAFHCRSLTCHKWLTITGRQKRCSASCPTMPPSMHKPLLLHKNSRQSLRCCTKKRQTLKSMLPTFTTVCVSSKDRGACRHLHPGDQPSFSKDAPDYTLIDVYTLFQQQALSNVRIDLTEPNGIHLDPHPSKQGHQAIADLMTAALKQAHAPKAAAIRTLSSSSKKS